MTGRMTRSASKKEGNAMPPPASPSKRPASSATSSPTTPARKRTKAAGSSSKAAPPASPYVPPTPDTSSRIAAEAEEADAQAEKEEAALLHPELKFKYSDAKAHLTSVDPRWGKVMNALKCKPFEDQEELKKPFVPFRSLVSSLLGQQISWLAARSIQHKFVRLFFPDLPEKLPPPDSSTPRLETPFPTPHQVLALPDRTATLRSAGLSGRKVEYVVELAERFADGRLSAKKLWGMDDEELMKTLVEVRGIGPWTVQMFQIFSAKRQDVLPVGDLGIQKNLCRWYSQDPSLSPSIHPRKLVPATPSKLASSPSDAVPPLPSPSPSPKKRGGKKDAEEEVVEMFASAADPTGDKDGEGVGVGKLAALGVAEVEAEKVVDLDVGEEGMKEEEGEQADEGGEITFVFPETSNGLTPAVLKSRLNGKKLKGNLYLSPKEMEELTAPWAPYRSVACWYLWSLSDGTGEP
ncbi:hypothetical protein JCM8547_007390 [Rhodosporidiobolus lusitaniae]